MFNLNEELKQYVPFDNDEKQSKELMLKFLSNGDNNFDRSNLYGHVTAGALVVNKSGKILLNHHKFLNLWLSFGGHCDGENDCLNVARREVEEESGFKDCQLISNGIFDISVNKIPFNAKKNEPEHYHYNIDFLFLVDDDKFKMSDESTNLRWVTIEQAKQLTSGVEDESYSMPREITKFEQIYSSILNL